MTRGEFVSNVLNSIRALNKDAHISRRYILSIGVNKVEYLLSQKLSDRSLFKDESIFKTIDCFKLEEIDAVNCDIADLKGCKTLMKSIKKLPPLLEGKYGSAIVSVTTVDGSIDFYPTTMKGQRKKEHRRYEQKLKRQYYYVKDGYLYLPSSTIEMVSVTVISLDEMEVEQSNNCVGCEGGGTFNCKSAWEYNFVCPKRFLDTVTRDTISTVLATRMQIVEDENPNLSENQKDRTTT